MSIINIVADVAGQIGVNPRRVKVVTTSNLDGVLTPGFLNNVPGNVYTFFQTDVFDIIYDYDALAQTSNYGVFRPLFDDGLITLVTSSSDNVILPVVDGNFCNFDGTDGNISDKGFQPS